MTQSVEFFFDFLSPYSYLASTQLESLEADIQLRPHLAHQPKDAWSFLAEVRPFHEQW